MNNNLPVHAAPKPSHKRFKKKRGNHTAVTDKVRKEVARRSMERFNINVPCCEICGTTRMLTAAHLVNASQYGSGGVPWNIAYICGTHGWTDTCHHRIDNTAEGREWKLNYAIELVEYYTDGPGRDYWRFEPNV